MSIITSQTTPRGNGFQLGDGQSPAGRFLSGIAWGKSPFGQQETGGARRTAPEYIRLAKEGGVKSRNTDLPTSWKTRRVTVMGLGTFGGGAAVTRFLVERGAIVTLTDLKSETELAASLQTLAPHFPERLVLGRHEERDFREADWIVVNPAVKPDNSFLDIAQTSGASLTTEMNVFWDRHRGRTIAVTGSNGKSTTAAMVHAILQAADFTTRLGGNIGRSLLEEVDGIEPNAWTVLELSSFQLHWLDEIQPRPDIAVVTNFSPNHLDWHPTLDHYRQAKQTILRYQTDNDAVVMNADDAEVSHWPTSAQTFRFGENITEGIQAAGCGGGDWRIRMGEVEETIPLADWLSLPGRHNQLNAAAAVLASLTAGATMQDLEKGLRSFAGLPHRLEFVIEKAGRRFYNDSIATTPESTEKALEAFDEPILLLFGGRNKGADLDSVADKISRRAKAVALLGEVGPHVSARLEDLGLPQNKKMVAQSLNEAVSWLGDRSERGDVVLLSPGCASYDWFKSFEDRGTQFAQLAKSWEPTVPPLAS